MERSYTIYSGESIIEQGQRDTSWSKIRSQRNAELAATDWRAVKDRVLPNEWKEYRQALRDITTHPDANTAADNWPEAPE